MKMPTDKEWYAKKAKEEGDMEISAGGRKTLTINLTPLEIEVLEKLANPIAAELRATIAELEQSLKEAHRQGFQEAIEMAAMKARDRAIRRAEIGYLGEADLARSIESDIRKLEMKE